ncbi:MAG TPA: hypothetical protein DEA08_10990, partial [Planctomycetes bacterium]|nr:hypothetical protein [Planctomycetota bacterium]
MSDAASEGRWDWLLDRIENPILVKELSGAFRRQRFLYLLSSLLGLASLVLLSSLLLAGDRQDASVIGRNAFKGFVWVELALVLLVFPAFSCTSIVEERAGKRFDLLVTTRLTPEVIARGKLFAALLYGSTFLVGTLPLVAVTFLYGGVSVGQIVLAYVSLALLALLVTAYGLVLGALATSTARAVVGTFISLPVAVGLVGWPVFYFWILPFLFGPLMGEPDWLRWRETLLRADFVDTVLLWVGPLIWVGVWVWGFLTVAANSVRAESGDHTKPLRLWFVVTWGLLMGLGALLLVLHPPPPSRPELLDQALLTFFSAAWLMFSAATLVFAVSDDDEAKFALEPGWRRIFGRGAWAGAGFVSVMAVVSYTAVAALLALVPDISLFVARGGSRRPTEILAWGTLWSLSYLLALSQSCVWLSRHVGARQARYSLLALVTVTTCLPVVGWAYAAPQTAGMLWDGTTLSPITVLIGLTSQSGADQRLVLFGSQGGAGGIEVYVVSSAIFLVIGQILLLINVRNAPSRPSAALNDALRRARAEALGPDRGPYRPPSGQRPRLPRPRPVTRDDLAGSELPAAAEQGGAWQPAGAGGWQPAQANARTETLVEGPSLAATPGPGLAPTPARSSGARRKAPTPAEGLPSVEAPSSAPAPAAGSAPPPPTGRYEEVRTSDDMTLVLPVGKPTKSELPGRFSLPPLAPPELVDGALGELAAELGEPRAEPEAETARPTTETAAPTTESEEPTTTESEEP